MKFVPVVRPINVRRDILSVTRIDRLSFPVFWSPTDFADRLSGPDPHLFGVVGEYAGSVAGFALFRVTAREIALHRIAVDPDYRLCGIARAMVDAIVEVNRRNRQTVSMLVDEYSVASQLFLRACGFRWTVTLRGKFGGFQSDRYRMVREIAAPSRLTSSVLVDSCG